MKTIQKTILLGALLTASIFTNAIADDLCTVVGFHKPGTFEYNGPTWCSAVTLPTIVVHGPLTITGSSISGNAEISGPVTASGGIFSDITIANNHSHNIVSLSDGSIVKNNITFETEMPGTVVIDSSSKIEGKIINGVIQKK